MNVQVCGDIVVYFSRLYERRNRVRCLDRNYPKKQIT